MTSPTCFKEIYGKYNILSNKKHSFLKYVVWQSLYMQTVTSAKNGGTERADFQVPTYCMVHSEGLLTVLLLFSGLLISALCHRAYMVTTHLTQMTYSTCVWTGESVVDMYKYNNSISISLSMYWKLFSIKPSMEFAFLTLSAKCLVNWRSSWKVIPRFVLFCLAADSSSVYCLPCKKSPASRLLFNSGCQRRSTMFLILKRRVVT